MSEIIYKILNKTVSIEAGETILQHSIKHKIPHLHECGGSGLCTTCRVQVLDGLSHLSAPTSHEIEVAKARHWDAATRLACQAKAESGPISIERLVWTPAETSNLQLETIPMGIGEEREMAFLFCDMRNFTKMAGRQLNFDLAHILNRFFTALGDPVFMNNGIIYQYAGDEIIALFGAGGGQSAKKTCLDSIRAAMGMLYAIERLNRWELKDFGLKLKIGIGVHFGKAFIGNIGHHRHKQFAVIGDPMNVTSRIQAKNKELNTEFLISDTVKQLLPDEVLEVASSSKVRLKGKEGSFPVYEIVGFKEEDQNLVLQASLDQLLKNEESFAARFYDKVFTRAPEVRQLFSENMFEQGRMLTHMLRGIIYALSRPNHLQMGLLALGRQHKDYGVLPDHYPLVRDILCETISEELDQDYTAEVEKAWRQALDMIIGIMQGV
ncbi:MAG: 2Fe-2S iron-sulfur cluster-binding protein [Saprospiraceae bacterium]|nr:2Fe-2S iron-sulfur cluster-binding protein [Saprospiraceae bacterium]